MKLLLHSLSEFRELIFSVLDAAAPRHIVEIGSESGNFTAALVKWATQRSALVTTIDPFPSEQARALAGPAHRLIADKSPGALEGLDAAEVYLVDGDHNYYTVHRELGAIHRATAQAAPSVVVLHDVGWPCARRDQYYDPSDIPDEHRHEYTYERGIDLDSDDTVEGGFRGNGAFAYAMSAGGARNGVLTAVEDFCAAHPDYELFIIPAVFGLGFLVRADHPSRGALVEMLAPYHHNALLARVDENRLRNYLRVIALQDETTRVHAMHAASIAERDAIASERDALRAERDALLLERASLQAARDALTHHVRELEQQASTLQAQWYTRYGSAVDARLRALKRPAK